MKSSVAVLFSTILVIASAQKNVVIDISHHNGKIDFEEVKKDGVTTVIHKCTQGTGFVDPKYESNRAAAEKVGLTWAAYHFADGTDGVAQAEHFLNHAGANVKRYVVTFAPLPKGASSTKMQAETLVKKIEEKTGSLPIVYGSPSFLDSLDSPILADCPLWLASYRETPKLPKRWSTWLMWEYTNGAVGPEPHIVSGVGNVQRSYLKGEKL